MRLTCLGSISLKALSSKKAELFRVKLLYFIHHDEDPEWETIPAQDIIGTERLRKISIPG